MKNHSFRIDRYKTIALLFLTAIFFGTPAFSQDTLHLNYHHTQSKAHDTTLARIDKWIKTLNGKHMDVQVVAYYHKLDFKQFADERAEEMFLILNRKARELFTIEKTGSKKGKDSQRTLVDIIYKPTVSPAEAAAAAAKAKAEAEAKKDAEKASKDAEKASKDAEKATKEAEKTAKEGEKKSKTDVAKEQTVKKDDAKKGKEDDKEKKGKEGKMEDDVDKDVAFSNVVTYNEGYDASYDEIKYIKNAKMIIAQTGKENIDENFIKAVKENWKINTDLKVMPYEEAKKMAKENKKDTIAIFSIAQVKTWFVVKHFGYEYRVLKLGRALSIENAKGKTLYKHFIPTDKEKGVTMECLIFGVSSMNYVFSFMLDNKISNSAKVPSLVEENAKELRNKTLMIGQSMVHPKLPLDEISQYYTSKFVIVPDQEMKDAILKKKDAVYVIPVKLPNTAGNYFYYVMDAGTGKIYIYDLGPNFQMTIGTGLTKNIDPAQSGYVDKANLQRFEKAIQGDPEKAAKRDEKAAKEREKVEKKEKAAEEKKAKEKEEKEKKAKEKEEKGKK